MLDTSKSLLLRASGGDEEAWGRVVGLYRPMILGWLLRQGVNAQEADDLCQDVLASVVKGLDGFAHGGRPGSFRTWLKTIAVNRGREFYRAGKLRARPQGGTDFLTALQRLEDPNSALSREWDAEHDAHLVRRLLEVIDRECEPATARVFRALVLDSRKAPEVARETGMSLAAVYGAKSRVLARLREVAEGLLD